MNKTNLCVLIGIAFMSSTTQVKSQEPNPSDMLSEAMARIDFINSLSGANPKVESHKTTGNNRAITTKVWTYSFGPSPKRYTDSTIYTNHGSRTSQLQATNFKYYNSYPGQINLLPILRSSNFAAISEICYADPGSGVFYLRDTSSYGYNANGDETSEYTWNYKDSFYNVENYIYDAYDRMVEMRWTKHHINGAKLDSALTNLRYGPNYVVLFAGAVTGDSAILDADSRVLYIYNGNVVESCTYDGNGRYTSYEKSTGGILDYKYTLTYEPDYKQYSYHYISNLVNFSKYQQKRILLGQSGKLDSVYLEWYSSTGVYLHNSDFTSVTTDSFGNITYAITHDRNKNFIESYRYYYEDVVTGLSDIRTPFSDFKVYPNPGTQSDIMISTGENFSSVNISSMSGQKVLHTSFRPRNEMRLDVSNLSAGSYLISIRSDDGRESSQVFTKL